MMPRTKVHADTGFVEYIQTPEERKVRILEKKVRVLEKRMEELTTLVQALIEKDVQK